MKIIDAHVHIYPDSIVDKATKNIRSFYGADYLPKIDGHIDHLLEIGKSIGIEKYVVHSCATSLHQVKSINDFIYKQITLHKEFIGFMTLYPGMSEEEIKNEVDLRKSQGFKGIKLHPDFQQFSIDDERMYSVYKIAENNMPILFHVGDPRSEYSLPSKLAKIAKMYPQLLCIAAHFGGWSRWDEIDCYLGLENIYFDTSSTLALYDKEKAKKIIYKHGVKKFFFGTDFPMWDPKTEVQRILDLNLPDKDLENIFYKNFERVFDLN